MTFHLSRSLAITFTMAMFLPACSVLPLEPSPPISPVVVPAEKTDPKPPVVPSAQIPEEKLPPPVVPPTDEVVVAGVLSDISRAMSSGGDGLKRELISANAAWNAARSDSARLRLALLVAMSSSGLADDQRALSLLEPWSGKSAAASAYKAAADLVVVLLIERTRLLRDEAKRTDAQRERAESLKKELDATAEKLNALRQLERNLGRRRPQ